MPKTQTTPHKRPRVSQILRLLRQRVAALSSSATRAIQHRPMGSFLGLLCALLAVIVIGHRLRQPVATPAQPIFIKPVTTFTAGATPRVQLQAKIEKSGVLTISAQAGGVVQVVRVQEGQHVSQGTSLVSLSTNYQGGNTMSVARQVAQRNLQFLNDNYDEQKSALDAQRQIAQDGKAQADQLRSITRQSFDDTNALINQDQTILDLINQMMAPLVATNVGGANNKDILGLQQAAAGTLASLNGARSSLRLNQYQADDGQQPAHIASLSASLTLTQLDLQQKMLDLNKDLASLNLRVSQINEALMYPAAPVSGTVERVFAKVGANVAPGASLLVLRGDKNTATAVVLVSADVAKQISNLEPTLFQVGDHTVSALPRSISTEPTDGSLFSVVYALPDATAAQVTNGSFLVAQVPIGVQQLKANDPFVPLDAVYQTQDHAYVLVATATNASASASANASVSATASDSVFVAQSRQVQLGQVFGAYVNVLSGISAQDRIIFDRNVVEGDLVKER